MRLKTCGKYFKGRTWNVSEMKGIYMSNFKKSEIFWTFLKFFEILQNFYSDSPVDVLGTC